MTSRAAFLGLGRTGRPSRVEPWRRSVRSWWRPKVQNTSGGGPLDGLVEVDGRRCRCGLGTKNDRVRDFFLLLISS